eukprot:1048438-Amphidinium_carterae.2
MHGILVSSRCMHTTGIKCLGSVINYLAWGGIDALTLCESVESGSATLQGDGVILWAVTSSCRIMRRTMSWRCRTGETWISASTTSARPG